MVFDSPLQAANSLMLSWSEWKLFFERLTDVSSDSLHVISGVTFLLLASAIVKRPVSSWRPWLVVLLLTAVNEASDLWIDRWPHLGMQVGESAKDILLTMVLPTMLLLSARFLPRLYLDPESPGD